MRRAAGCILAIWGCVSAHAAGPVDEAYVRSLAAPGKTVLVMENVMFSRIGESP